MIELLSIFIKQARNLQKMYNYFSDYPQLINSSFICVLQHEWRYLLAGGTVKPRDLPNPAPDWLSERSWGEILTLAALPKFGDFAEDFSNHLTGFKKLFDNVEPHR